VTQGESSREWPGDESRELKARIASAPCLGEVRGALWSGVVSGLAVQLEARWHELLRSSITLRRDPGRAVGGAIPGLFWQGPLEPLDEDLRVGLSDPLCHGLLYRLLGGAADDRERANPGGEEVSPGPMELQLLEPLVASVASGFCDLLHQLVGIPVMAPCLWLVAEGQGGIAAAAGADLPLWIEGAGFAGEMTVRVPGSLVSLLEHVEDRPGQKCNEPPQSPGFTPAERRGDSSAVEVVLAEVELCADDVRTLAVGDLIPLGRPPGTGGEWVWLEIPGQGRVVGRVTEESTGLEVRCRENGAGWGNPPGGAVDGRQPDAI